MKWIAGTVLVLIIGGAVWWWQTAAAIAEATDQSDLPMSPAEPPEPDDEAELKLVDAKLRGILDSVLEYRLRYRGAPVATAKRWEDMRLPDPIIVFHPLKESHFHLAKHARRTGRGSPPFISVAWSHLSTQGEPDMDWIRKQGDKLPIAMISEEALGDPVDPNSPKRFRVIRLDGSVAWHTVDGRVPESQLFPVIPGTAPKEMGPPPERKLRFGRN